MYVSEKVKEGLRKYAAQTIQIDAKEVDQPQGNPGDSIIKKFEYIGVAPETQNWIALEGICLTSSVKVGADGNAIATITIENKGNSPIKVFSGDIGLTLLVYNRSWSVGDGPSAALITRQSFFMGGSEPRWQCGGFAPGGKYTWTIGKQNALPHDFTLASKEKKQIDVQFDLPDGQYDFLCGYGGGGLSGKCLASNLSAFDVVDRKAVVVEVKNR